MQIGDLLYKSAQLLRKRGIQDAFFESEILAQHVLKITRADLIAYPNTLIRDKALKNFLLLLEKRLYLQPLAQIIGTKGFWEYEFITTTNTLTPRPESEILIQSILKLYPQHNLPLRIADFGTGSGCLLLTLLLLYKNACGQGFEKNKASCVVFAQNIVKYKLSTRAKIIFTSWQNCTSEFDIIVSNPPYIRRSMLRNLQIEIKKYEPKIALDGGFDGLTCYREIFTIARQYLKKSGRLVLEIGSTQYRSVQKLALQNDFTPCHVAKDFAQHIRCLVVKK